MQLWEVSFRSTYEYPFMELSRRFGEAAISMWCVWDRELVRVATEAPELLATVEEELEALGRVTDRWTEGDGTGLFLLRCTCDGRSPWTLWETHGCTDVPPALYRNGWGYFRVLTFQEDRTRDLFRSFRARGPTELLRKRELPLSALPSSVWVDSLFGELTDRQIEALVKAHRYGHYATPRPVTTEAIAQSVGISRSTYEEHLRKAEKRVLDALMPHLELYAAGTRGLTGP